MVEGDYFFIGIGNKYNTDIVKRADEGAVVDNGMIWVDEYFKVGVDYRDTACEGVPADSRSNRQTPRRPLQANTMPLVMPSKLLSLMFSNHLADKAAPWQGGRQPKPPLPTPPASPPCESSGFPIT